MKTIKIISTHLLAWFIFTGVMGVILGPSINIDSEKIDFDKISQGIPTLVSVFSTIYLLTGWLLPYRYFNKKNHE
jgi:hypothetical protein